MTKRTFTLFFILICGFAMINMPVTVSAEEITGTPDDTPGVFIYTAGSEETAPGLCDGQGAGEPTQGIIQDAINFGVLEFVGDEPEEVLDFVSGGSQESPFPDEVDTTSDEVVTGLTAIDDFGDISSGGDDNANFDTGTGGEYVGGLRNPFQVVAADGIIADGILGGPTGATTEQEANDFLGGMEIFIFEDAEMSGFQLELFGPLNTWVIKFDDFQVNPGTINAADDMLYGIDLDSLPGWDGTYIVQMRLVDDGIERTPVDSCDGTGPADQSLEIDAIATRSDILIQLGAITGTVTEDIDDDDIGDLPMEGVILSLLDGNGDPVLDGNGNPITTTTNAQGDYAFLGLEAGDYSVVEIQPEGFQDVSEVDGGDDGDNPDNGILNNIPVTVSFAETDTGNDFVEEEITFTAVLLGRQDVTASTSLTRLVLLVACGALIGLTIALKSRRLS